MSKMGTAYINHLNAEEEERFKRQEQAAGEDFTLDYKQIDPKGGRKAKIVNAPVHCVQCGEEVSKLVFCSGECEKNYKTEQEQWLDGIEELLPSNRDKQSKS